MDPLTMLLISAGIQAASAAYRGIKAQKGLKELQKQKIARYSDAAAPIQENKAMYQDMAKFGMGPASTTLAKNQFAAGQKALSAAPAGGQLRTQIGRLASANAGGFANQLAAQNEAIRRQGMAGVAQANLGLSSLQQRDVATDIQRRMQQEQAYGQAMQDARREALGAVTGVATGYLGYQNAEANRQMYRDVNGPKTPASTFNPVAPPGTYSVQGPQLNPNPMTLKDLYSLPPTMGGLGGFYNYKTPNYSLQPTRVNSYNYGFGAPSFNPNGFVTPASYDLFGPF